MDKQPVLERLDCLMRLMEHSGKAYLKDFVASQIERLRRIINGRPYVLCTFYIPSELACLYDAEFLYIDRTVGLAASAGLLPSAGEELGPLCSYQQAFYDLLRERILPPPALLLWMEYPCTDAGRLMQAIHRRFGTPLLSIARDRMQRDLMEVKIQLDRRYDHRESVDQIAARYRQANAYKASIDRLRVEFPGIADSADLFKLFTVENDFGSAEAVNILKTLYETLAQRVRMWQPRSGLRLFWLGLVPLYDIGLIARLPEQTGFRVVFEEMWMFERPDCHADDFFSGMAERVRRSLFYDPAVRVDRILARARELSIDAVVHFSQRRCSFLPPAIPRLRGSLEELGIPWVGAGTDVIRRQRFDEKGLLMTLRAYRACVESQEETS